MFVRSLSCVWILATPWAAIHQSPLSFTNSPGFCLNSCPLSWWCYLNISSCLPFLLLPYIFPSTRDGAFLMSRLFTSGGKVLELQLHISSNEYSGLISFWIDWFVLLSAQGSLKSLLQHHQKHRFFHAQPSLWSNSHIDSLLLEKP